MMELRARLEALGLAQYAPILHENGFEDWNTVLDITEEDLDSLGFKRGHRRVLQKEIATARGSPSSPSVDGARSGSLTPGVTAVVTTQESFEKKTKRRYRWHPRADPNAPKKPKTAYVNFADHLRSDPTIASLSFVDIAREVGKRWQTLDPAIKQEWENKAAQAMQAFEDRMDAYRLTKQHQDYQDYLETFKKAPGKSARQKMKSGSNSSITSPRRSESSGPERSPSASIESPTLGATNYRYQDQSRASVGAAIDELDRYARERPNIRPFSAIDLPPEPVCRHAIAALLDGGSSILYLISTHEAESLLHRLYRLPGAADLLSLVELCVLTALGGHFSRGSVAEELQSRLMATVCKLMEQLTITDALYLRLMRVFLCLAMHSVSEKNLSARTFSSAGLAIATVKFPSVAQEVSHENWTKVYRTLIFIECWISEILGSSAQHMGTHVRNVVEPPPNDQSLDTLTQWHAVRIAVVGNDVCAALRPGTIASPDTLRYLAGQLDLWQRELPQEMQLASLLSSPGSSRIDPRNQQALFVAHIFYLGAVIMLYGQPLLAAEQAGQDTTTRELGQHRDTCLVAGEQIATLMHIINKAQIWTPRSWTVIYWAFSACNVLLLGAAQALRARSTNDFDRLISHSSTCLATLESCAKDEPVAARYLDTTSPIYARLKRLRESPHIDMRRRKSEHKIKITDLLASEDDGADLERWNTINEELPGVVREVVELLKEPFGRAQQQRSAGVGGPSDPYPSPPTGPDLLFWFRV